MSLIFNCHQCAIKSLNPFWPSQQSEIKVKILFGTLQIKQYLKHIVLGMKIIRYLNLIMSAPENVREAEEQQQKVTANVCRCTEKFHKADSIQGSNRLTYLMTWLQKNTDRLSASYKIGSKKQFIQNGKLFLSEAPRQLSSLVTSLL